MVTEALEGSPRVRLSGVLEALGIARSRWYRRRVSEPKRAGRRRRPVPEALAAAVRGFAERYPWWGYKRIAVVARRAGVAVTNKQVYRVM